MDKVVNILAYAILGALYIAPVAVAVSRRHHNAAAISLTALLFGWTGLGWAIALVWSFTNPPPFAVAGGGSGAGAVVMPEGAGAKPAPAKGNRKRGYLVAWAVAAFVIGLFVLVAYSKITGVNPPPPEATGAGGPAIPQGVPVPAEELFGE
jgi:hypothetical protein